MLSSYLIVRAWNIFVSSLNWSLFFPIFTFITVSYQTVKILFTWLYRKCSRKNMRQNILDNKVLLFIGIKCIVLLKIQKVNRRSLFIFMYWVRDLLIPCFCPIRRLYSLKIWYIWQLYPLILTNFFHKW